VLAWPAFIQATISLGLEFKMPMRPIIDGP
jgi:hypothetical protein